LQREQKKEVFQVETDSLHLFSLIFKKEEAILIEKESTNSGENMIFSLKLLKEKGAECKVGEV